MLKVDKQSINHGFDNLVRTKFQVKGFTFPAFQLCGAVGLLFAIITGLLLASFQGLSLLLMLGLSFASVVTFFVLAMATKIVVGKECLIYYHHEIAIILVALFVLWLVEQPNLRYLDITIIGIGIFLTCGRIGCLMVGCCHGRPDQFGVCYRREHMLAGFTPYYIGVRLFPIQIVESLWALFITLIGVYLILANYPPGSSLVWYLISYNFGRFFVEFYRGDPVRHYWKEFSEAQWISLLLMVVVVALQQSTFIPYQFWHLVATIGLALTMVVIAVRRHFQKTPKYKLLNPRFVREIAQVINDKLGQESQLINFGLADPNSPLNSAASVSVSDTSAGIRFSTTRHLQDGRPVHHVAMSSRDGQLSIEEAQIVAEVIQTIKRHSGKINLLEGGQGVYHLLF